MALPYVDPAVEHQPSDQKFEVRSLPVVLGEFWSTKALLDQPVRIVGEKPVAAVLEHAWPKYPWAAQLQMPYPNLASGFELLSQPARFADVGNRLQSLTEFRDALEYCGSDVVPELSALGEMFDKQQGSLKSDKNPEEFRAKLYSLTKKHGPLGTVLDVEADVQVLLQEKKSLFSILSDTRPDTCLRELCEVTIGGQLVADQAQVDLDGLTIDAGLTPHHMAFGSLGLLRANCGGRPMIVINCRSVSEVLAKGRSALINLLSKIRGAHYIDLAIMNPVSGTQHLKQLGAELDKQVRCCVWATLGGIVSEQHAIKVAAANPLLGTEGAGNVFVFIGLAKHLGFPAVISAGVLGTRLRLDDRQGGLMNACFGPQSCKCVDGIDELDTMYWQTSVIKDLTDMSGFIVVIEQPSTGVLSPFLAHTQSSLEKYMYLDASRMATMLTGYIMAYLGGAAPSGDNEASVQRSICDIAQQKFFGPYEKYPGFKGDLKPMPSSAGTRFDVGLDVHSAFKIEEIHVIRTHGK